MKTFQQKKIQRKIAKASRRGRYLIVAKRGSRARPGRKKGLEKKKLLEEHYTLKLEPLKMHIPKMTKK